MLAQGRASWRFSHVLVREALYREIDPATRAEAHQRVAAALEASGRGDAVVAEIAHHRLAALPEGDAAAAAAAARAAADRAMAMLAFEDAALLLQRARQALESTPAPDRRGLCELELLEGMAWMRAGDGARGRAACSAAADEARRLGAGDLLARAALGYGAELMLAQTDPTLVALLQEALRVLPAGSGRLARAGAGPAGGDAAARRATCRGRWRMAREAIAMARAIGDTHHPAHGPAGQRRRRWPTTRRRRSGRPSARSCWRWPRAAGDRFQLMRAQSRLVFDYLELGRWRGPPARSMATRLVAREFRQARHIWPGRLMRSMLESAQGRFDEAARLYDEAAALAEGDADPPTRFVFAWCRLGHALESERAAELAAAEEQIGRIHERPRTCPSCPRPSSTSSIACVRARDVGRPRRALPAGPGRPRRPQPVQRRWSSTPCWPSRWPASRTRRARA